MCELFHDWYIGELMKMKCKRCFNKYALTHDLRSQHICNLNKKDRRVQWMSRKFTLFSRTKQDFNSKICQQLWLISLRELNWSKVY